MEQCQSRHRRLRRHGEYRGQPWAPTSPSAESSFDTTAYTINTGANTLTLGATNNTISLDSVAAATITGTIAGTGNFILSGNPTVAGTLTLNNTGDGWSGTTTVNAGSTL